ncbi:ABC transporter permease [Glutamicibacter sp.]|nr:ABC transporter permease subunit [Glutamicibacter sp.]HJX78838.1 ABC transporter permease subunit [Glutamicibacter sp.]
MTIDSRSRSKDDAPNAREKARVAKERSAEKGGAAWYYKVGAIAAALLVWHLVAISPLVQPETLPTPLRVLSALSDLWQTAAYWSALGKTISVWALGLAVCAAIGIPLGLLIGASLSATRSTSWIIDFFRTIPTIALLPLVLLLYGTTIRMEITMIVLSAVWPLLIQAMYAVKQIEPLHKWVVRVFRLSTKDRIRFLWIPSISLFISTGLRLSATMALLMTVAAEYIGGAPGLGAELSAMEQAFRRPEVFAYTITAGVLGLSINSLVVLFQRKALWWHPIIRGEKKA